ncbi:hypothetical protein Ple7327_4023 [Pleurocapsa sp. PCC 7327]|uniref:CAAD domain-containing protein n=1 Tax=Pleurocapsa sp. PCC 7327 TaxID=118163 RepID=UPI00029F86D7|nr:CAAD domain-containing protein [Pleurocapsa sp. PCC 7327]AFY79166.1 hypothetical protein Ple7327_4023 [Pleurocapsa sp. PCC 7327]
MVEPFVPQEQLLKTEAPQVKLGTESAGTLAPRSYQEKSLLLGQQITNYIEQSQQYWNDLWQAYKKPVILLGWFVGAGIALKLTLAVMGAINDVPLLEPIFELVGLGYTVWFGSRYLIRSYQRSSTPIQLEPSER